MFINPVFQFDGFHGLGELFAFTSRADEPIAVNPRSCKISHVIAIPNVYTRLLQWNAFPNVQKLQMYFSRVQNAGIKTVFDCNRE